MAISRPCFYVTVAALCAVVCYYVIDEVLLEDDEEVQSSVARLPPTLLFPLLPSDALTFATWLSAAVTFALPSTVPSSPLAAQCAALPHCPAIAGTACGWCWDLYEALPGGHKGDVNATCSDWTWFASQCALHVDCDLIASCPGIVGTHCGWCKATQLASKGGAAGPKRASDCESAEWVFDYRQCEVEYGPQHLHLMYGDDATTMVATWATATAHSIARVRFAATDSNNASTEQQAVADTRLFTHNNEDGLHFVHRANMSGLTPGARYRYYVANDNLTSATFEFTAAPPHPTSLASSTHSSLAVPRFIVYGDMGRFGGAPTLRFVEEEVEDALHSSQPVTAVLHLGDFAYDMKDSGGVNGDAFMARIQRLAASTPYITTPGNHEIEDNSFSHYRGRFTTPGMWEEGGRMYYSLNLGLIHFVSYDTEMLFSHPEQVTAQVQWLEADLTAANARRTERPWIVAFGHRPFYCSNNDGDDCTTDRSVVRATFETLFDQHGVDLILEAHEHSYERLFPVYDTHTTQRDYVNPLAATHIVTGTAGCNEQAGACINPIPGPRGDWSAFHSANRLMYGYGHLQAVNATHLWWGRGAGRGEWTAAGWNMDRAASARQLQREKRGGGLAMGHGAEDERELNGDSTQLCSSTACSSSDRCLSVSKSLS